MLTKKVSPRMTSDNSPTPYKTIASSVYDSNYLSFKAFDNSYSTDWSTSSKPPGYIQIYTGEEGLSISHFSIIASSYKHNSPRNFIFYGSNDGTNFDTLYTSASQSAWYAYEVRKFSLKKVVKYKYYKLYVSSVIEGNYVEIAELQLHLIKPFFLCKNQENKTFYFNNDNDIVIKESLMSEDFPNHGYQVFDIINNNINKTDNFKIIKCEYKGSFEEV